MRNLIIVLVLLIAFASPCLTQSIIELPLNNGSLDSFLAVPINAFINDPLIIELKNKLEQGKLDMVVKRRGYNDENANFWMDVNRVNDFLLKKSYNLIEVYYYTKNGQERLLFTAQFNDQAVPVKIYARIAGKRLVKLYRTKDIKTGEYKATICDMFVRVKAAPIGRTSENFDGSSYCFVKKNISLDILQEFEWFFEFAEMLNTQINNKLEEDASVQQRLQDWLGKDND